MNLLGGQRQITIVVSDTNDFAVVEGDRFVDRLCFGEMLEMIVEMTLKPNGVGRYPMLTGQQWADREKRYRERMAALDNERRSNTVHLSEVAFFTPEDLAVQFGISDHEGPPIL